MNDANKGNKLVSFTYDDAQRIAEAVKANERGRRGRKPSSLPRAAGSGGSGGGVFMGEYLGAWPKGQTKIVSITDLGVTFTAATTVTALNRLADIMPVHDSLTSPRVCYVIQLESNTNSWHLINAET